MATLTYPNDPLTSPVDGGQINENSRAIVNVLNPMSTTGGLDNNNISTTLARFLPWQYREPFGRFAFVGRSALGAAGSGINEGTLGSITFAVTADIDNPLYAVFDAFVARANCHIYQMAISWHKIEDSTGATVAFPSAALPAQFFILHNVNPITEDDANPRQFKLRDRYIASIEMPTVQANATPVINRDFFRKAVDIPVNEGDVIMLGIELEASPATANALRLTFSASIQVKTLQKAGSVS